MAIYDNQNRRLVTLKEAEECGLPRGLRAHRASRHAESFPKDAGLKIGKSLLYYLDELQDWHKLCVKPKARRKVKNKRNAV